MDNADFRHYLRVLLWIAVRVMMVQNRHRQTLREHPVPGGLTADIGMVGTDPFLFEFQQTLFTAIRVL